jgi:hypothetical protein
MPNTIINIIPCHQETGLIDEQEYKAEKAKLLNTAQVESLKTQLPVKFTM